jgi:hypothetical protein
VTGQIKLAGLPSKSKIPRSMKHKVVCFGREKIKCGVEKSSVFLVAVTRSRGLIATSNHSRLALRSAGGPVARRVYWAIDQALTVTLGVPNRFGADGRSMMNT